MSGGSRLRPGATAALALALALGGCGFRPLYGPDAGDPQAQLPQIFVARIPDRSGQLLRQALQQRLAGASDAAPQDYTLSVNLGDSSESIGIHGDNSSARTRMVGRAHWTLTSNTPVPAIVASGDARTLDGYNNIDEQYFFTTLASESTQARIASNLADSITTQLATWFSDHPKGGAAPGPTHAALTTPAGTNPAGTESGATYLTPQTVPGNSNTLPVDAAGPDGMPESAIGRNAPTP